MKRFLMGMILFLLLGCASTIYTHPDKSVQDFDRDRYECEKIAEQSAANWGMKGNPIYMNLEIKKCLEQKCGWRKQ